MARLKSCPSRWSVGLEPHLETKILQLLVKFAGGAGDVDAAGDAAFAILGALDDAGWLAALGAIGGLRGIHFFLTVGSLCNLGHDNFLLCSAGRAGFGATWGSGLLKFCMSISGLDPQFLDGEAAGAGGNRAWRRNNYSTV